MSKIEKLFAISAAAAAAVALSVLGCGSIQQAVNASPVAVPSEVKTAVDAGGELVKAWEDFQKAFSEMSIEDERMFGESVALQAYSTPGFGVPVKSKDVMLFMNCMANAIGQNSDRPMIPYHVVVVKSKEVNAFAAPGGYVFVTTGLVDLLENEGELAMVVGHEIAHVTQRHAIRAIQRGKAWQGLFKLISAGAKLTSATFMDDSNFGYFEDMVKELATEVMGHTYSTDTEIEADEYGLKFAMATGYHPDAMLSMLEKLKRNDAHAGGTHPTAGDRIAAVKTFLQEHAEEYPPDYLRGLVKQTGRLPRLKGWIRSFDESAWTKR